MPWLDDLVTLTQDGSDYASYGETLFTSTKSAAPLLASGTLTIVETAGSAPERTQNAVIRPAYLRLAAQFMARADTYTRAKELAQEAYNSVVGIRNCWVVSEDGLMSGWYREIVPLQEPFDAGVDDRKQARCGFNVIGTRRP